MPRTRVHRRGRGKGRSLTLPLVILALALIAAAALFITDYYMEKARTERTNARLIELYSPAEPTPAVSAAAPVLYATRGEATPPEATFSPAPSPIILAYPTPPGEISESFRALYEINPDLIGRLYLPSATTPIELFVVKRDNDYYLKHDFNGEPSEAGTLFLDEANTIWPQDQHMIIYGHNMKNGTMFARLTKYKSIVYAARNPLAYFDTLYEKGVYVVFAALRLTEAESLADGFNIRTFMFGEGGFLGFLSEIRARALYVTSVDMNEHDQLLTLITCSYNEQGERFMLVLRRLREGETEQDIYDLIDG